MMICKSIPNLLMLIGSYSAYSGLVAQEPGLPKSGLPATDRDWFGADYARAAEAFTSHNTNLPRISEKRGAELLQRLTSTKNLSFYQNKSLPIQSRLEDFFKLQGAINAILKEYIFSANKGENVHAETARILAFSLRVSAVGLELIEEFLPTIPKDDKYDIRMDGLKKVKSGLTTQIVGIERSLTERDFYSVEDLSLMIDVMATTLPVLKRGFPAGYPAELRERLKSHRQSFTGEADRKNIDRMLAELETSPDGADARPK